MSELAAILGSRMESAVARLRALVRGADSATVDAMLELGWFDLARWRSTEATAFWVCAYALLMCRGEPRHLPALRAAPDRPIETIAHRQVDDARALAIRVIEQRGVMDHVGPESTAAMPTTRAALVTYIGARLGDRRWRPGAALVRFADRPRFKLESFEGLAVYAALLLHASDRDLESVAHLAARDPIIAAIRATRGLEIAAPPVGADLLAAIYRDPASDAARAVYADFLIDRGDDRGELIAAQLAGEQPPIAGDQAVAWAGAVGPVLRYRPPFAAERPAYTPRIRRGFLSGARVDAIDPPEAAEWSTVEVLDCGGSIAGLGDCDLRSLIGFGGLDGGVLRRLVDAGLAGQLVALGLAGGEVDRDALDRFTALRIAVCGAGFDDLAALLEHPASARLELLAVAVDAEVPGDIGARIVRLPRSLATGHCLPLYDEIIAAAPRRSS